MAEGSESGQDLEAVLGNLRNRSFTILADALDEAQEPATIASAVLQRLATLPRTRVIVGTRASTKEGPDQPFTTDQDLLDALGRGHATIMRIERDPEAISAYVRRRLALPLAQASGRAEDAVDRVVALSGGREREFLFARLAVHEIIARPALLSPELREELETLLGGDHRARHRRRRRPASALGSVRQFHSDPLAGHAGSILDVICFARDGREDVIVTSGFDSTVLAWKVAPGQPITSRPLIRGHRVLPMCALTVRAPPCWSPAATMRTSGCGTR